MDIALAPLIDLIFLLLIFFLVSTSFTKETGVEIERPKARSGEAVQEEPLFVAVTSAGTIHFENQRIPLAAVRDNVARSLSATTRKVVVVMADTSSRTGLAVDVVDQCRLAGAERVFLSTSTEE